MEVLAPAMALPALAATALIRPTWKKSQLLTPILSRVLNIALFLLCELFFCHADLCYKFTVTDLCYLIILNLVTNILVCMQVLFIAYDHLHHFVHIYLFWFNNFKSKFHNKYILCWVLWFSFDFLFLRYDYVSTRFLVIVQTYPSVHVGNCCCSTVLCCISHYWDLKGRRTVTDRVASRCAL